MRLLKAQCEKGKGSSPPSAIEPSTPRSQAIYGSLVETFGPYSRNYTRMFIFIISSIALS